MAFHFRQKIKLDSKSGGLLGELIYDISASKNKELFSPTKVIVSNKAVAEWMKDRVADKYNICANLDFVVLPGAVITNIYLDNNPTSVMFNFEHATFILYQFFSNPDIYNDARFEELKPFLFDSQGNLQIYRVYQLAHQVKQIFFEYIFLRTEELFNGKLWSSQSTNWQKVVWDFLIVQIQGLNQKTFLDVFKYFTEAKEIAKLPRELYVFALPSVYPSQLKILLNLSNFTDIYWYYLPISENYYGDLLAPSARLKLEKKLLGYPDLNIDDLYLLDGNPLVANLGQQSRELTELLISNGVQIDFGGSTLFENNYYSNSSILNVIKNDILDIKYRLRPEFRLQKTAGYYEDPIDAIETTSIQINVCYNKMREVQVMFNSIAEVLQNDNSLKLSDILITAPDIDDYAPYIEAVFNNEYVENSSGETMKIPYAISGNRRHKEASILETLMLLFEVPYHLPVTFLLDVISDANVMNNLDLDDKDIDLISHWLKENNVHFGYSKDDYSKLGYSLQDIYGLRRFLVNLTLGLYIPNVISTNNCHTPTFVLDDLYAPYDNLEFAQSELLNKLIKVVDTIVLVRNFIYTDEVTLCNSSLDEVRGVLDAIKTSIFTIEEDQLKIDEFIGTLPTYPILVNKPIIYDMIKEFAGVISSNVRFTGKLTFSSMQNMRGIPYRVIYIMGMNFGEYPRVHTPNKISLLAKSWYIADRNYTLEDKQIFLDMIMAAQDRLLISYVGMDQNNNSAIEPSPVLSLFLETVKNSFNNNDLLNQIMIRHSLHPFYNNCSKNYSGYWKKLSGKIVDSFEDQRWNFNTYLNFRDFSAELMEKLANISAKELVNTLLYTNYNLHNILQITRYNKDNELDENESFDFNNYDMSGLLFKEFTKFDIKKLKDLASTSQLSDYLLAKGIIASGQLGIEQINAYLKAFERYSEFQPVKAITAEYVSDNGKLRIIHKFNIDASGMVTILGDHRQIKETFAKKPDLSVYAHLIVTWAILNHPRTNITDESGKLVEAPKIQAGSINLQGELKLLEYRVNSSSQDLLQTIIDFYRHSLVYPTIIHKEAIRSYLDSKYPASAYTIDQLYSKLIAEFNNSELKKIKLDPLWNGVVEKYPNLMKELADNKKDSLLNIARIYGVLSVNSNAEL